MEHPDDAAGADRDTPDPEVVGAGRTRSDTTGLEVSAVARRFGVAPATLRSWHRRYGIGPRGHVEGGRRLYRPEDVAQLRLMHEALTRGASAAEAARWARAVSAGERRAAEGPPTGSGAAAPGRTLPLAGRPDGARGLARAALALDPDAVRRVLADSIGAVGVVRTWDGLARPVLVAVADRWAATGRGVEVEHLLTECLVRELDRASTAAPPPLHPRPVLLACVPDEAHSLPLAALTAALAERRVATRMLGAALPLPALAAAVRRTAPVALALWSQARPCPLDALHADLRRLRCAGFTGGPGWSGYPAPPGFAHLSTLTDAVDTLQESAHGRAAPSVRRSSASSSSL